MNLFFLEKYLIKLIVVVAAITFITTAINSHGFYHADEHYQIIEFAGLKLGTNTPNELAWEFKDQIRPTLQPIICFLVLKTLNILNIINPYTQALILRLLSALLALVVILFFIQNTKHIIKIKTLEIIYYLLSYFLWFIPMISVRFSSETWSGLLFLLSLSVYFNSSQNKTKPFQIGLIFGISFLFRFQIAFALVGFVLWLIIVKKSKLNYLIQIAIPFLIIVLFGIVIDSWFYGTFAFTPWNYFASFIESGGNGFGVSPWYFYIVKLLSYPSYFIGVPIFLSLIILIIFNPNNYLLWCIIPFIVIHSFIPHKEERFLFSIIYFFPLLLIEGYLEVDKLIKKRVYIKALNVVLIAMFVLINSIGLIAMGQKSAGIGRMKITKYIHDKYGNKKINLIFCPWSNPYNPWHGLPIKFYLENSITDIKINSLCELNDSLLIDGAVNFLVIRKIEKRNVDCLNKFNSNKITFEIQSIPKWIELLNEKYKGFENDEVLELYKLETINKFNIK